MMSWLTRRLRGRVKRRIDPHEPHAYRSVDEVAMMGATNANQRGMSASAPILAMAAQANSGRCRPPGFGRPPEDPIHR